MPFDSTDFLAAEQTRGSAWWKDLLSWLRSPRRPPEPLDEAVLRVLAEARGLIEQREDWTQGTLETFRGERCAVGALRLAADFLDCRAAGRIAHGLLAAIALERGFASIEAMNDRSRHDAVLSAFDQAIGRARDSSATPRRLGWPM